MVNLTACCIDEKEEEEEEEEEEELIKHVIWAHQNKFLKYFMHLNSF